METVLVCVCVCECADTYVGVCAGAYMWSLHVLVCVGVQFVQLVAHPLCP